jgi:hypothetical protein
MCPTLCFLKITWCKDNTRLVEQDRSSSTSFFTSTAQRNLQFKVIMNARRVISIIFSAGSRRRIGIMNFCGVRHGLVGADRRAAYQCNSISGGSST